MKPNQVYNFLKDFKFPQYFLLMNYKINKTLIQTLDEQCRPFSTYSWGHKLYIDTLWYDNTFISNKIKTYKKIEFAEIIS
jgi:hypothetical protein